ncbi:MAG: ABC transporter permease [Acidimicrobiia bacterium]|nr:ABC transporter permease [Acidimicrobiia bacterium]MYB44548.1 ABC transporter permease [Acidimicrobiia bacterium]MYC84747.1 ABC transporter permease [Acidimicrobiia bacterium]
MSVAKLPAAPETASPTRKAGRGVVWWAVGTVLVLAALVLIPGLLAPADPYKLDIINRFTPPHGGNLFGTDDSGRDILSRVIHGARYSIGSAVLIITVAALVGTVYGSLAAWYGGILDRLLMRTVDVFLAFPYLVFAMAVAASMGRGLTSTIVALSLLWWPSYARMIRGQVKSILNDYHIRAATTLGARRGQILRWHVIPHTYNQLLVRFTLDIGNALVALTGLAFLGLGATPPLPEWGRMVADSKQFALLAWWYAVFPGVVIFATVLNFVLLGEALRKRSTS